MREEVSRWGNAVEPQQDYNVELHELQVSRWGNAAEPQPTRSASLFICRLADAETRSSRNLANQLALLRGG